MFQIKGIILDLFKTLIYADDHFNDWRAIKEVLIDDSNYHVFATEILPILQSRPFDSIESVVDFMTERITVSKEELIQYFKKDIESVNTYDDTIPFLEELKRRKIKTAIISNLTPLYIEPVYKLGLNKYIDIFYLSCIENHRKPEEICYLTTLKRMDLPAGEIAMIGDNEIDDVIVPAKLGFTTFLLDRGNSANYKNKICSLMEFFDYLEDKHQ